MVIEGLRYFFSFMSDVPPRFATPTVSIGHLAVLLFFAVVYTVLTVVFKHKDARVRSTCVRTLAMLLPLFYLLNEIWLVSIEHFTVMTELPLQLCGAMYLIVPAAVLSKNRLMMEFVYACGMPGAFVAMLSPTIHGYYFISWGYLGFMLMHSLVVYVPLFMLITGDFKPRMTNFPKVACLFVSLVVLDYIVDTILSSNYLYLRWAPDGTLLDIFAHWAGTPGYIFVAFILVILVWTMLYLPWGLYHRAKQRVVPSME